MGARVARVRVDGPIQRPSALSERALQLADAVAGGAPRRRPEDERDGFRVASAGRRGAGEQGDSGDAKGSHHFTSLIPRFDEPLLTSAFPRLPTR